MSWIRCDAQRFGRDRFADAPLIKKRSTINISMNPSVLLYIIVPIIVAGLFFGALRIFFQITHTRSVTTDVVQGILVGAALAFITVLLIVPNFYVTKVNGWTTMFGCGESGSGLL